MLLERVLVNILREGVCISPVALRGYRWLPCERVAVDTLSEGNDRCSPRGCRWILFERVLVDAF